MYPRRSLITRLPLLGLALPAVLLAQSVNLTVDVAQTVRMVDERVFGVNSVIWDGQAASAQTINLLQQAGVRTVRVPGGSLSDVYHWRTNRSYENTWTWMTGFNGFAQLISGLDAEAFVTVNYGTGTPEEAAAWVAYANSGPVRIAVYSPIGTDAKGYDWRTPETWIGLRVAGPLATDDGMNFLRISRETPLGIKYWEIGNECYGNWETDEQAVPHDPYTYAVRAKEYIAKMKAVDSSIKVGVVVTTGETSYANNTSHPATNPRTGQVRNGWTPVMLTTLKSLGVTPDFAIYHRYEQGPGQESDAGLLQSAKTWATDAADLRQQLNDYLGAAGAGVELVVTENNSVYTDPGKQSTSLVNGLFLADSVGNLLQTEFNAFMWWGVRNGPPTNNGVIIGNMSPMLYGWRTYGDYGMLSSPATGGSSSYYEAYPTYYMLKLLSYFARGGDTVVKATSNNNLLAIYAVKRSNGTLCLLVINKDPVNTLNANIAFQNYTTPTGATFYSYGIPQDNAAKPGGSGSVDLAAGVNVAVVPGSSLATSFAPYSAEVLIFDGGTASPPTPTPAPPTPAPAPTTPTTPTAPASSGGGGGAIEAWFVGVLALLAIARRSQARRG
jgi:hypothetical protein